MTCPLYVGDKPVGLLFFSSRAVDTYDESHVQIMKEIAMHLAMLLMAAAHVVCDKSEKQVVCDKPEKQTEDAQSDRTQDLPLSQLKIEMALMAPLFHTNKTLLLSTGTVFTQQTIDRLIMLDRQGIIEVAFVSVQ